MQPDPAFSCIELEAHIEGSGHVTTSQPILDFQPFHRVHFIRKPHYYTTGNQANYLPGIACRYVYQIASPTMQVLVPIGYQKSVDNSFKI